MIALFFGYLSLNRDNRLKGIRKAIILSENSHINFKGAGMIDEKD